MAKEIRKFLQNPAHLIIFLPLIVLVAFIAANLSSFPHPNGQMAQPAQLPAAATPQASPGNTRQTPECPDSVGCCAAGSGYTEKPCAGGQACVNNECQKKACESECCDDESSGAEYAPKACGSNFLCDNNKCVQRQCWKDCCVNDPAYETKECASPLECISNKCEKPACPDSYQCCPASDSSYREKACKGNLVCKFRFCKTP